MPVTAAISATASLTVSRVERLAQQRVEFGDRGRFIRRIERRNDDDDFAARFPAAGIVAGERGEIAAAAPPRGAW